MELGQEELFVSNDQASHMMMIKGKRTKRPRPQSPPNGVAVTSSSSSACGGNTGAINGGDNNQEYNFYGMMNSSSFTTTSPTTSGEIYESTEEEEDMANCLILLAQGHDHVSNNRKQLIEERISQNENMGLGKAGFFVYECKTCTRTFPSFQALGGHRASHKKPKSTITTEDQKKPTPPPPPPAPTHVITSSSSAFDEFEDQTKQPNIKYKSSPVASIPSQIGNKPKIHECSICGSEFTSGQALGGHMRRHRSAATAAATNSNHAAGTSTKLERNVLPLDLNLPAPEDYDHHHHHHQHRDSKFQFVPTQQTTLVFNAPALVDCHY